MPALPASPGQSNRPAVTVVTKPRQRSHGLARSLDRAAALRPAALSVSSPLVAHHSLTHSSMQAGRHRPEQLGREPARAGLPLTGGALGSAAPRLAHVARSVITRTADDQAGAGAARSGVRQGDTAAAPGALVRRVLSPATADPAGRAAANAEPTRPRPLAMSAPLAVSVRPSGLPQVARSVGVPTSAGPGLHRVPQGETANTPGEVARRLLRPVARSAATGTPDATFGSTGAGRVGPPVAYRTDREPAAFVSVRPLTALPGAAGSLQRTPVIPQQHSAQVAPPRGAGRVQDDFGPAVPSLTGAAAAVVQRRLAGTGSSSTSMGGGAMPAAAVAAFQAANPGRSNEQGGRPMADDTTVVMGAQPQPAAPAGPVVLGRWQIEEIVDTVIERIERRVIDDLERRGRRHLPGVFS